MSRRNACVLNFQDCPTCSVIVCRDFNQVSGRVTYVEAGAPLYWPFVRNDFNPYSPQMLFGVTKILNRKANVPLAGVFAFIFDR